MVNIFDDDPYQAQGRCVAVRGRVAKGVCALAVDESGMVFDPSTSAPMVGTCTLAQYLRFNQAKFHTIVIGCCYRVREVDQAGEGNPSWF